MKLSALEPCHRCRVAFRMADTVVVALHEVNRTYEPQAYLFHALTPICWTKHLESNPDGWHGAIVGTFTIEPPAR